MISKYGFGVALMCCFVLYSINSYQSKKIEELKFINANQQQSLKALLDERAKLEKANKELDEKQTKLKHKSTQAKLVAKGSDGAKNKLDRYFVDVFCGLQNRDGICKTTNTSVSTRMQ